MLFHLLSYWNEHGYDMFRCKLSFNNLTSYITCKVKNLKQTEFQTDFKFNYLLCYYKHKHDCLLQKYFIGSTIYILTYLIENMDCYKLQYPIYFIFLCWLKYEIVNIEYLIVLWLTYIVWLSIAFLFFYMTHKTPKN